MKDIQSILDAMTLEEKANFVSGRDFWKTQDLPRLGIPAVMMCDGPNGLRKQNGEADHLGINESIETVCYPTASAVASSFDTDLLRRLGEILGDECQSEHVAMLLGPGVNMKRSPLCGRNFEYFSEDPYLSGKLASAYIRGIQSKGVAACVKHFACNNQETRRMSGSSQVDERTLREIYLPAFEMAVKEGKVRSVMCAYNAVNGTYCSQNKMLLTDILRKEWGYKGFVVTDWGAVKDRVRGLLSGCDLEMPGAPEGKTENIVAAVREGVLPEKKLDEAVLNLLKFVLQASENQQAGCRFDRASAAHQAGEMEKESAVLLKNDGHILPLDKAAQVAFIGEFASKPRYQGSGSSHINVKQVTSAVEAAEGLPIVYARGYNAHEEKTDDQLLAEAVEAARRAKVAVIFAGLPESFESEGADRETMSMPQNQNELISAVASAQPQTVVVLHGGSAMEMPWINQVKGVLLMHLGGIEVGRAAVELLYGDANPSGKLAETWPIRLEDNPSFFNFPGERGVVAYDESIYTGYRYYDKKRMAVQFPFGHGLSYTQFTYSDLRLDKRSMTDSDTLTVSCTVENTGKVHGKEAVQLYVGCPDSSVRRAVRELKGFCKVDLAPGEKNTVSFTLDRRAFAYYETEISDWLVESGRIVVEIGSSSRDIRLSNTVQMQSAQYIPMTYTRYSPIGDLALTPKGRALLDRLVNRPKSTEEIEQQKRTDDAMGEGAEKMRLRMMMEMPLNNLYTFGRMSEEQMLALVNSLNE